MQVLKVAESRSEPGVCGTLKPEVIRLIGLFSSLEFLGDNYSFLLFLSEQCTPNGTHILFLTFIFQITNL